MSFIETLRQVVRFLERHKINYCIAGGFAVTYYGVQRTTSDIDMFIAIEASRDTTDLMIILQSMQKELKDVSKWIIHCGFLKVYVGGIEVDILPYGEPIEKYALKMAVTKNVYGVRCKIIRLEDLFLLKYSIADTEERHLEDVHYIIRDCKDKMNLKVLSSSIQALRMQRYTPEIEKLLGAKLS